MVIIEKCPICKGISFQPLYTCKDTTVSHETFSVIICQECSLGITSPRPDDDQLSRYYLSEDYISHSGKSNNASGKLYVLARKFTLNWKRNIVRHYSDIGTILDLGCGTGEFLLTMKNNKWNILGVEPSEIGRNKAESLTGNTIYKTLDQITGTQLNVISMWHVLEHISELQNTINSLRQRLTKKGKLFIAVPNYLSYDANYYKESWAGFDVPRHLWHFSKQSMHMLLGQNGFTIISILPMPLDAYYISMLSERYNNSSWLKQIIRAVEIGTKSNLAGKPNSNHSSLLYIAERK